MVALVTGDVGSGKTTVCQRVVDLLRVRGLMCRGVLSPARLDATGAKIGIDVVNVETGERRRFADLVPGGGETIGEYTFDQASLDWAIGRLLGAVTAENPSRQARLLVVDEIGPLELVHRSGYVEVLEPLADPVRVPHALVVVRWGYVDALERQIKRQDVRRFWVDEVCRASILKAAK